jgi:hypothetical protein
MTYDVQYNGQMEFQKSSTHKVSATGCQMKN